ncbi:hypothetical protein BD626DRAFT_568220 [Schizophyllum amplum]|uniref:B30.2/SPRY domain-containing protein n=1 Tax=Schizophyllum amplum TaxID=97359 RepID=A0A550CI38_9AGAR|nr:hypothetical protein BD626DRAFT_568220 [Auriculariopsis ampla]
MIAEESPPPGMAYTPPDTPASIAANNNKKRKRGPPPPQTAATPEQETDVISSRSDLSNRPRLEYARGPLFIPIQDSDLFRTDLIPMNHIGFRYTPAGIHPVNHLLPLRTIAYRPPTFRAAFEDRSPYIGISQDGLTLEGCGGFRTVRCTAPMREGKWYMEIEVVRGGGDTGAHVRLGWSRRETLLNGPIGLDGYSYAYRDRTGDKVTLARPRPYGRPFGTGDIIGMYISLPPRRPANPLDPHDPAHLSRVRIPIDYKGQEVFEALEYKPSPEMTALMDPHAAAKAAASASRPTKQANDRAPDKRSGRAPGGARSANAAPASRPLPRLHGAHIAFFVNGVCQGVAFEDILDFLPLRAAASAHRGPRRRPPKEGQKEHRLNAHDDGTLGYYPSISLYGPARVRLNPGPDFVHPPPDDVDAVLFARHAPLVAPPSTGRAWRPACERYGDFMAEQRELDRQEEIEGAAALAEAQKAAEKEAAVAEKKRVRREADAARRRAAKNTQARMSTSAQPSPLRHATAYSNELHVERKPSLDEIASKRQRADYDDLDESSPYAGQAGYEQTPEAEYEHTPEAEYEHHGTGLVAPAPRVAESAYAAIMSQPREVLYDQRESFESHEAPGDATGDVLMQDAEGEVDGDLQDDGMQRASTPESAIQSTPGSPTQSTPGSPVASTPGSPMQSAPASPRQSTPGSPSAYVSHAEAEDGHVDADEGNASEYDEHVTEDDMPNEYAFQLGQEDADDDDDDPEGDYDEVHGQIVEGDYDTDEGHDEDGDEVQNDGYGDVQGAPADGYSSDAASEE